jgi:hypothetical protein
MRIFTRLLLILICICGARADEFLPGKKRILFIGDSITYAGQYVDEFESCGF